MASCPNCGASLEENARYCAQCGQRVEESTRALEAPAEETGEIPVEVTRVEPRLYGVTPSTLVLALAGVALTLAVVFFAIGHWPIGLILLGVTILLALMFLEAARRKPAGAVSRSTAAALDSFRERAGVAADVFATRGRAATQLLALRRELQRMPQLRSRLLVELGDAVYRGDEQAREVVRGQLEELDRLAAQREAEMKAVVEGTRHRIERRRFEAQPTEVVERSEEPAPGELNPPEPARIPEPYPPPDEGSPPQPAVIPEPGPAVIPEPGPDPGREASP